MARPGRYGGRVRPEGAAGGIREYLQQERAKLCFKINVPDAAQQTFKWKAWNLSLMQRNGAGGVNIKRSKRKEEDYMTVAVLSIDYRQADDQGRLDFERTVQVLQDAEAFMDAAVSEPPECSPLVEVADWRDRRRPPHP